MTIEPYKQGGQCVDCNLHQVSPTDDGHTCSCTYGFAELHPIICSRIRDKHYGDKPPLGDRCMAWESIECK